jgi:hypothetical protein
LDCKHTNYNQFVALVVLDGVEGKVFRLYRRGRGETGLYGSGKRSSSGQLMAVGVRYTGGHVHLMGRANRARSPRHSVDLELENKLVSLHEQTESGERLTLANKISQNFPQNSS